MKLREVGEYALGAAMFGGVIVVGFGLWLLLPAKDKREIAKMAREAMST